MDSERIKCHCGNDRFQAEVEGGTQIVAIYDGGRIEILDNGLMAQWYYCTKCDKELEV